jgi:hypothetical protein
MRLLYYLHGLLYGISILLWTVVLAVFEFVYYSIALCHVHGAVAYRGNTLVYKVDEKILDAEMDKALNGE